MSLPQAAVTLVCHGEDVRRQLPHLVFAVQSNGSGIVKACDLFVRIDCCQDGSDVRLRAKKRQKKKKKKRGERSFFSLFRFTLFLLAYHPGLEAHVCDLVPIQILSILAGHILGTISSVWVTPLWGKLTHKSVFVGHHLTVK